MLFTNNTTVGYALFNRDRQEIEYIFVHPDYRAQGYGRRLVDLAEKECGMPLKPAEPLSPSGIKFFRAANG